MNMNMNLHNSRSIAVNPGTSCYDQVCQLLRTNSKNARVSKKTHKPGVRESNSPSYVPPFKKNLAANSHVETQSIHKFNDARDLVYRQNPTNELVI